MRTVFFLIHRIPRTVFLVCATADVWLSHSHLDVCLSSPGTILAEGHRIGLCHAPFKRVICKAHRRHSDQVLHPKTLGKFQPTLLFVFFCASISAYSLSTVMAAFQAIDKRFTVVGLLLSVSGSLYQVYVTRQCLQWANTLYQS